MADNLFPNYEGPPNENINIWAFGESNYLFVEGVAISRQQAYDVLDAVADDGRDANLTKHLEEYSYLGKPFEEIVALKASGDDNASDFLSTLETVKLSEHCHLYIDKLRRGGKDGQGPVIIGYPLVEIYNSHRGLIIEGQLELDYSETARIPANQQTKKTDLEDCLVDFQLPTYVDTYVISAR